jgi:hypothetical protein
VRMPCVSPFLARPTVPLILIDAHTRPAPTLGNQGSYQRILSSRSAGPQHCASRSAPDGLSDPTASMGHCRGHGCTRGSGFPSPTAWALSALDTRRAESQSRPLSSCALRRPAGMPAVRVCAQRVPPAAPYSPQSVCKFSLAMRCPSHRFGPASPTK